MSLLKKINKIIDASIVDFTIMIAEKYGLDHTEILDIWKDVVSTKVKKKAKSAFHVFAAELRIVLREKNPDMTFGQLSTEISKRWKLLSDAEKATYAPKKKDEIIVTAPMNESKTKSKLLNEATKSLEFSPFNTMDIVDQELEKFQAMKTKDLITLCKEKFLKTGNRDTMINQLYKHQLNHSDD